MELAVHEKLELHEILMFKSICTTKSATMQALVTEGLYHPHHPEEQLKLDLQAAGTAMNLSN